MTRTEVIAILGHILVGAPHDEANEALAQAMDLLGGACDGCGTTRERCLEYRRNGQACCPDCRHTSQCHSGDVTKMVPRSEDEIRVEFEAMAQRTGLDVSRDCRGNYCGSFERGAWAGYVAATRAAERRQA